MGKQAFELIHTRGEIVAKAVVLAREYGAHYRGCGQSVFLAMTDGCAIMRITEWTAGIILDEFEKGGMTRCRPGPAAGN